MNRRKRRRRDSRWCRRHGLDDVVYAGPFVGHVSSVVFFQDDYYGRRLAHLRRRESFGGRKGRAAARRLRREFSYLYDDEEAVRLDCRTAWQRDILSGGFQHLTCEPEEWPQ